MKFRGYYLQLRPLRSADKNWQLEIETGEMIHTHTINCNKTLSEVEDFAFDQIDKLIEEEKKQ